MIFWADVILMISTIPHVLFILYIKNTQNTDFQKKLVMNFIIVAYVVMWQ